MDIYSSSVRAEYAFAYRNWRGERARARTHAHRAAAQKILLHNHERRRISQTDHWRCCLENYVTLAYCLVKTLFRIQTGTPFL